LQPGPLIQIYLRAWQQFDVVSFDAEVMKSDYQITRLTIAMIVACVIWLGWILSIANGYFAYQLHAPLDLSGEVIGADFIQFYSAGQSILDGDEAKIFDREFQHALQNRAYGGELRGSYFFNTPPWFALLFAPLALLPFRVSFLAWILLQFLAFFAVAKILNLKRLQLPFVFSFFPFFAAFSYGQNSILLMLVFALILMALRNHKLFLAGVFCSLLSFKPQFMSGLLLWWGLRSEKWILCKGFAVGVLSLLLVSLIFVPDAVQDYFRLIFSDLLKIEDLEGFPFSKLHTIYSLSRILLPSKIVGLLFCFAILIVGLKYFYRIINNQSFSDEIKLSAAILFTILMSPYTLVYDLSILVLPATILYNQFKSERTNLTSLYTAVSVGIFVGVPVINPLQAKYFHHWLNVSELAVLIGTLLTLRKLSVGKDTPLLWGK